MLFALYGAGWATSAWGGALPEGGLGYSHVGWSLGGGTLSVGSPGFRLSESLVETREEISNTLSLLAGEAKTRLPKLDENILNLRNSVTEVSRLISADARNVMNLFTPRFVQQFGGATSPNIGGYGLGGPAQVPGIIPFLVVSERYDSNVFYAPKIAGLQREDYVTNITPGIQVFNEGQYITTRLVGAAISELYVRNTGLNFVGFYGQVRFDLSRLAQRLDQRLYLQVYDSVSYSPGGLGFLGGNNGNLQNGTIDPNLPVDPADVYIRGVQGARTDTFTNAAGGGGAYRLTPLTSLQATYVYSFTEFGKNYVAATKGSFFSSRTHSVTAGPRTQISPMDSVYLNYNFSRSEYGESAAAFETHGGTAGWTRLLAQQWTSNVYAGAALLRENTAASARTAQQDRVTFLGGGNIMWNRGFSSVTLSYAAGVIPSIYGDTSPILNQTVAFTGWARVMEQVAARGTISYSRNEALGSSSTLLGQSVFFETIGGGVGARYLLSDSWAVSIDYAFNYFKGSYFGGGGLSEFTRSAVTIGMSKMWQ